MESMQTAIVLVSHYEPLAIALKDMIEQLVTVNTELFSIFQSAGTVDKQLGTNPIKILNQLKELEAFDQIYIFCDMGSAYLSSQAALNFLSEEWQDKVTIYKAPFVESSYYCAIQCSLGKDRVEIEKAMNKHYDKR